MNVEGEVNNKRLQLLIYSGSTHNFLYESMADKLGCRTEQVAPLKVLVANDNEMSCNRVCKNFQWCMQGQQFSANVFLVPLKNYHMIFFFGGGVQRRATLDDILWNFSKLTMKFVWVEELRELKGNRGGSVQMSNLDKMNKLLSVKT